MMIDDNRSLADFAARRLLPAVPEAAGAARNFVTEQLREQRLDEYVDNAQLVISELVTNAIARSAPGEEITVGVVVDTQLITLLCHDVQPAMPQPRNAADMDENGRGLLIVGCLSKEWGVVPTEPGKVVWATIGRKQI